MLNFNDIDEDEIKTKSKMYAITTWSIIGVIIIFIIVSIFSIKSIFNDLSKHKYYVIDINNSNKEDIINLLENEGFKYCESMYKIEYEQLIPDDKSAKISCKNEDDINLSIYDDGTISELANYIHNNGKIEKR